MNKVIVAIVILFVSVSIASASSLNECITKGDGYSYALNEASMKQYISMVMQGDIAAIEQLYQVGFLAEMKEGVAVYVEESKQNNVYIKIRGKGTLSEVYVIPDAIECQQSKKHGVNLQPLAENK